MIYFDENADKVKGHLSKMIFCKRYDLSLPLITLQLNQL